MKITMHKGDILFPKITLRSFNTFKKNIGKGKYFLISLIYVIHNCKKGEYEVIMGMNLSVMLHKLKIISVQ